MGLSSFGGCWVSWTTRRRDLEAFGVPRGLNVSVPLVELQLRFLQLYIPVELYNVLVLIFQNLNRNHRLRARTPLWWPNLVILSTSGVIEQVVEFQLVLGLSPLHQVHRDGEPFSPSSPWWLDTISLSRPSCLTVSSFCFSPRGLQRSTC